MAMTEKEKLRRRLELEAEARARAGDDEGGEVFSEDEGRTWGDTAKSVLRTADDVVRGAADTLTFGFADEIAGYMDDVTGIDSTESTFTNPLASDTDGMTGVEAQRQRDEEAGMGRIVGQVAGALPLGYGMIKGGLSLPNVVAAAKGGKGVMSKMGANAAEGALLGAIYGYGSGENVPGQSSRARNALDTAMFGGAAGAAIPGVTHGIRGIRNYFKPQAHEAGEYIMRELSSAGLDGDEALRALDDLPEGARLPWNITANRGGGLQQTAEALATLPQETGGMSNSLIRQAAKVQRELSKGGVKDAAEDAFGPLRDFDADISSISNKLKGEAAKYYDVLDNLDLSMDVTQQAKMFDLMQSPAWKSSMKVAAKGLQNANARRKLQGKSPIKWDWLKPFDKDGNANPNFMQASRTDMPFRTLDLIKQEMNQMIGNAKKQMGRGKTGASSYNLTEMKQLKDELVTIIDDWVDDAVGKLPDGSGYYEKARDVWGGKAMIEKAFKSGDEVFNSNVSPTQFAKARKGFSSGQKKAQDMATRAKIEQIEGTSGVDAEAIAKKMGNPWTKQKIQIARGPVSRDLVDRVDFDLNTVRPERNAITGGSPTANRIQRAAELTGWDIDKSAIREVGNLNFGDAASHALAYAFRGARRPALQKKMQTLAKYLTDENAFRELVQSNPAKAKQVQEEVRQMWDIALRLGLVSPQVSNLNWTGSIQP